MVPGEAFGIDGYFRLSCALGDADLEEGVSRLAKLAEHGALAQPGGPHWHTWLMPRPIAALPKAHLHLHFTGSMRHGTLVELASKHRVHLPESLAHDWPPQLSAADARGWFRFQRLYDIARSVIRTPPDVRRLITEAAQDEHAEGSGWLELQVKPPGTPTGSAA